MNTPAEPARLSRRDFLKSSAALAALGMGAAPFARAGGGSPQAKTPMNIIYIHCHDAGRYLSPYGYAVPAPNLDAFAAGAVTFRQAFCNAPTCSPSRAALLTGVTAHQAGMLGLAHRGFSLANEEEHLCRFLARHGYQTALCGVQHEWDYSLTPPYEAVIPQIGEENRKNPENDLQIARAAAAWLRERKDPRPLFLAAGFYYPHRVFPEPDPRFPADRAPAPAPLPDNAVIRGDMAAYQTAAWWMDKAFGEVWKALQETGLDQNSLILFTTDHGIAFPKMKASLTDHGMGVAFIVKAPGQAAAGAARDEMVSHLDFFPTVCDYAGLPVPERCLGRSLRPLLEGRPGAAGAEEVFAEVNYHAGYEPKRAVRTARYKYIRNFELEHHPLLANIDPGPSKDWMIQEKLLGGPVPGEELYDLWADPNETRNLAGDPAHRAALEDMRGRLERWMKKTSDPLLEGHVPAPPGARVAPRGAVSPRETAPAQTGPAD